MKQAIYFENETHFENCVREIIRRVQREDAEHEAMVPKQPQPAPRLCEAVESVLSYLQVGEDRGNPPLSDRIRTMRQALAAEVKRQEAMGELISVLEECRSYLPGMVLDELDKLNALEGGGK